MYVTRVFVGVMGQSPSPGVLLALTQIIKVTKNSKPADENMIQSHRLAAACCKTPTQVTVKTRKLCKAG
jgi:hypothetical protein